MGIQVWEIRGIPSGATRQLIIMLFPEAMVLFIWFPFPEQDVKSFVGGRSICIVAGYIAS